MNGGSVDRPFDLGEKGGDAPETETNGSDTEDIATNEAEPDEFADTGEFEVPGADPDSPEERISRLEAELQESKDKILRLAADFENYRKRIEREKSDYMKFANERLLRDLLPIADNLSRAMNSAKVSGDSPAVLEGVELVLQDILKIFDRFGVTPVESKGKPFDPMVHEALQTQESDQVDPGAMLDEVQRGYLLHNRVLRPALVIVSASPEETSPGTEMPELPSDD